MTNFFLRIWLAGIIGIMFWSSPVMAATPAKKKIPPKPKYAILLQDKANGFAFTSTIACRNAFKIKAVPPASSSFGASYNIFLSGSRLWPRKVVWTNFTVMSRVVYDAIPEKTQPDKPDIIFTLANGNLLTQFMPQDKPRDFRCTLQEVPL